MAVIPDDYLDLLNKKVTFANVATVMKDGSPQVTPVWFDYTGGKIRINTARGRVKARTMKEGTRVAIAIMDPENPYRYIQVRGRVASVTENVRLSPTKTPYFRYPRSPPILPTASAISEIS